MTPQASPSHFLLSLGTLCAFALGAVSGLAQSPPNLTHVDNVNNAGNATLYWDVFEQQGTEEFVQNEIKVFDLDQNPLGTQWHIISSEIVNGNLVLPTGWVMPSFLYDANQLAHCYIGVQVTVDFDINGQELQSVSDASPFLCSIHLSIEEGAAPGTVDLEWNSPYALSGDAAGGDFQIERLSELTQDWELVDTQPDSPMGGTYTDNPGPCAQVLIYRIRQLASNGTDMHESNRADLVTGVAGGETPQVSHVDVDNGFAHVYWDFEPEPETLGYIVYKCLDTGGGAIVADVADPNTFDLPILASNASAEPESYQVAAYDCVDDDGTPNPAGAGDCVRTVFMTADQIPCTDRAQLAWLPPVGMAGGVAEYIPQYREDGGPWISVDTLGGSFLSVVHEGASLTAQVEYRVLALGGEFDEAASNIVEVSFEYPDAPEAPVLKRVSVLDRTRVELVLATDPLAEEVSLYEFQRWSELDSSWIPLVPRYPSSLGFPVSHVDVDRNTDEFAYRYRALAFNNCEAAVAESQEAETMLLRAFQSTTPGLYENSLIWTPYGGFANGLDRYEVIRKQSNEDNVMGESLATVGAVSENYEDDVEDEFDSPGIFCYRVLALEIPDSTEVLQGAASNWVCLTEEPVMWIPSAFTPNGDELNDWFPWAPGEANVGFLGERQGDNPNFRMTILTRWGTEVFESTSIDEPWNGRVDGRLVANDVYVVKVEYLDGAGAWRNQLVYLTVLAGQ